MNRIKKVIVSLVILIIMILQIIPTPSWSKGRWRFIIYNYYESKNY